MSKKVKELWKHSDGSRAGEDMPPTEVDAKLREKHIRDSIPYNTSHATDHLEEIVNQMNKLKMTDPKLAKQLGRKAAHKLHKVEQRVANNG